MAKEEMLYNCFINDNKPPHHYIIKGLTGNLCSDTLNIALDGLPVPGQLKLGEKYYIGSDGKNFPDAEFKGSDTQILYFRAKN
jgi:hypothetical protein